MNPKTVFVGLSGGVDSSVAAGLLLEQGYNVVGVFIKVWHPDFMVCNWEAERVDAMKVAATLGIPFLTCDAELAYKEAVANYFIESYKQGQTPNPDVLCNKEVKFGVFLEFALKNGADYIATGHYAQVEHEQNSSILKRGVDTAKDQSYFLWTLTHKQLKHTLFPVGHLPKPEVRKLANKFNLLTASKKDSQGICFLGHVDIAEFLSHYVPLETGDVLASDGLVIGKHSGALVYTIGQRHGFSITHKSEAGKIFYVKGKDIARNTITVDTKAPEMTPKQNITLYNCVFRKNIKAGNVLQAQTRYRQTPFTVVVNSCTNTTCEISPQADTETPAVGQSCVLYDGEECLGGGIID